MPMLERWFAEGMTPGNRNNQLLRYALCLVDYGLEEEAIEDKILTFNKQIKNGLSKEEIKNSIMKTVHKTIVNNRS